VIHGILWGLFPSRIVPGLVNVNTLRTWKWWFSSWIYPYKMVIFHSYVSLPEGTLQTAPSSALEG
jgi:hypothetical protein